MLSHQDLVDPDAVQLRVLNFGAGAYFHLYCARLLNITEIFW
jgi:hypothetical protein